MPRATRARRRRAAVLLALVPRIPPVSLATPVAFVAFVAFVALVTLVVPARGVAQPARDSVRDSARDSVRTDPLCWRGRPLPRCRSFLLFELGYHAPVVGTRLREVLSEGGGPGSVVRREPDFSHQFVWAAGLMRNRDARSAIGGNVLLGTTRRGSVVGLQARYRQWTGPRSSAEVAVGPIAIRVPEPVAPTVPPRVTGERVGVAIDGRLNFADRIAGGVRLVAVPDGGRMRGAVLAGGNVGSGVAVAGTVLTGLAVAAVIAAFLYGYDG